MTAAVPQRALQLSDDPERLSRALLALLELSRALGSEVDLDALLPVIVQKASSVVDAERTSIYVYDEGRDLLWTRSAQGLGQKIELPSGTGVAGDVARTRQLVNIADAYADPRFNPEVDRSSGFRTRSMLAAPVLDSSGRLLGVVQSVNKVGAAHFDGADESLITAIAGHTAVAMERARFVATVVENERLAESLKLAAEIQMRMLPDGNGRANATGAFEIRAHIRPAKMVGGDLYDFAVDDGRLYFCIGDVSGKGVGAALVMALTKTLFRDNVPHSTDAARLTEAVNARLCEETGPTMFVTAFCGFLDTLTGVLHFCNAGHDRPFLLRRSGAVETLESKPGIALGVLPQFRYPLQQMKLEPGDALFLYTDGVTEASAASGEMFTIQRVEAALQRCTGEPVTAIVDRVIESLDEFVERAPQVDDITMLCVRYRGAEAAG